MADRIIISTQWLESCANELRAVQNVLNDAGRSLANVDLSHQAGGDKSITFSARRLRCGARISGDDVTEVARSAGNGITALAGDISSLVDAIARNVETFIGAEVSVTAIANGLVYDVTLSVYNSGDVTYAKYEVKYNSGSEVISKNREQWNNENRFRNTQYDEMVREELRDLLVNDTRFRKSRWESLETDEEREQFIRDFINALQEAYGTELDGDIVFVDANDFVDGEDYHTYTVNGVEVRYPHDADGGYSGGVDSIFVKMYDENGNLKSYEDLVDTLCHENRHNLQTEIVNADDLDKYDGVNGEDYDAIVAARDEWIENNSNYQDAVISEEDKNRRAEEINDEMNWIQKIVYSDEDRRILAEIEEYEDYAEQQNEVDARYTGEYARELVNEQRAQERAEQREAAMEEARRRAEEIRDEAEKLIDWSRRGWEYIINNT